MTNADKHFRNATDEELAEYLSELSTAPSCTGRCHKDYEIYGELRTFYRNCWLDWLKQEVPVPPQKKPLCDNCKHDNFAAIFCAARLGYFGQVTECKDYIPREVADNG